MKRIFSLLLVVAMMIPMLATVSSAAYENTYSNTGNQIEDIIGVAMTQVGYKEGNSSSQLSGTVAGSGNYTKYGKWYGINPGAWCAMFVSWCANQAGISTSIIPRHASCDIGMNWFKSNGRWQYSRAFGGSYTPKRGDIIYFGNNPSNLNDSTHVAIVTGVDASRVYTVEGNKGNMSKTYSYSLTDDYIFGYGIPAYTNSSVANYGTYIVTASSLNMRQSPSSSATIVGAIPNGASVVVTGISGSWAYTTYSGKSGWCSMSYLLAMSDIQHTISDNGIEFIKGFEGYSKYAYWDVSQWSIGYGTGCGENEYPNGITEAQAEALLRTAVVKYELYVSSFLAKYDIKVNQNQYDALVSFTYNLGNVWGDSFTLRTYLINGVSNYTNDQIIAAFCQHNTAGGQVLAGLTARRKAEANLFLSGSGSSADTTWTITFDPNGGTMSGSSSYKIKTGQEYNEVIASMPKATRSGYTLKGWHNDKYDYTLNLNDYFAVSENATFTAVWEKAEEEEEETVTPTPTGKAYTITFDPNGGTMVGQSVYGANTGDKYIDLFGTTPVAVRDGYTFKGWYNEKYNYTLTVNDYEYFAISESASFVAQWTKNEVVEYTLSFNVNGGKMPSGYKTSYSFEYGEKYASVIGGFPVPTRDGYSFKYWKHTDTGTTFTYWGDNYYAIKDNATLKAIWQGNSYSIKYYDEGGATFSGTHASGYPTTHTCGTKTALKSPTKTGYDFLGWYTDKSCTNKVTVLSADGYTSTVSLYAKWSKAEYKITYKDQGNVKFTGDHPSGYPTTHTYTIATTLKNPTRQGYSFEGWYTDKECTNRITVLGATAYTADITLYAKWNALGYVITYKDQNGSAFSGSLGSGSPAMHFYGEKTTLVNPTKVGYTFKGWYTKSACSSGKVTSLSANGYTENITLYAKWVANEYDITYKDQGNVKFTGDHAKGYPKDHTYDTATQLLSPTRKGYTFHGWYLNSGCTGSAVTTLSAKGFTSDITLYAKWTIDGYSITYRDQNGAAFSGLFGAGTPTRHVYGTKTELVDPTKVGYTFKGWYTKAGCGSGKVTSLSAKGYTADIVLYAKWTVNEYDITYKDQGNVKFSGSHAKGYPKDHTYDTTTQLLNPTRKGYTFRGWYLNSACSGSAVTSLSPKGYTNDITLYAKWEAHRFTITYKDKGGSNFSGSFGSGTPTVHSYGTVTNLVNPTRPGYKFVGWYTKKGCGSGKVTKLTATGYTENITLYAKWKKA